MFVNFFILYLYFTFTEVQLYNDMHVILRIWSERNSLKNYRRNGLVLQNNDNVAFFLWAGSISLLLLDFKCMHTIHCRCIHLWIIRFNYQGAMYRPCCPRSTPWNQLAVAAWRGGLGECMARSMWWLHQFTVNLFENVMIYKCVYGLG